jgi:hypothetical protein
LIKPTTESQLKYENLGTALKNQESSEIPNPQKFILNQGFSSNLLA